MRRSATPPTRYDEVVFCGFGEPLLRLQVVREVAAALKGKGARIRVNTDGLANLVHGRNILPELAGVVDALSVSLNAPDAGTYARICPNRYGEESFPALLAFLREAPKFVGHGNRGGPPGAGPRRGTPPGGIRRRRNISPSHLQRRGLKRSLQTFFFPA